MAKYFDKATIFAWMPMIGFDREKEDKGVGAFLERTQFTPDGTSVFLFHPDFVLQHDGLDKEVRLHPDNCSYYASQRNEERCRQDWTNYDIKTLVDNLNEQGIEPYVGIMGITLDDMFHREWVSDHPELCYYSSAGKYAINVLKRFKDGTYFEDFFVEQLTRVIKDYGFKGLHVADRFCPGGFHTYQTDYSNDMLEQFTNHTGITIPQELLDLEDNSPEACTKRSKWVWQNCRAQWILFVAWRWTAFWKKVCDRLHELNAKAFVLGMYCTDPFETLYYLGIDLRKLVQEAGVDNLMPNMAANGISLTGRAWNYYKQANMMPLTDAFTDGGKKLNMLGVKDSTEQWDVLHHEPVLLERDITFLPSFMRQTPNGNKRCIDGFNICLADGIYKDEWAWLKDRFDRSFTNLPAKSLAPTYVWSDTAFYNLLPDYIQTRRWSMHKFMYEQSKLGAVSNSIVRTEHITEDSGDLVVFNFDLLSEEEKKKLAAYRGGAVICTASAENGFRPEEYGIKTDIYFEDQHTVYKNCAFAYNLEIADKDAILALLDEDDDTPILEDPFNAPEIANTLRFEMPFQKVSIGFRKALALLMRENYKQLFTSDYTVIPARMEDGAIRMMVINDNRMSYVKADITINHRYKIKEAKTLSSFPVLPIQFSDVGKFGFFGNSDPSNGNTMRVIVPQGGISVVDVYLEDK